MKTIRVSSSAYALILQRVGEMQEEQQRRVSISEALEDLLKGDPWPETNDQGCSE